MLNAQLAQCPCSGGGGGGNGASGLLILAATLGIWALASWIGRTWKQEGVSMRMKMVKIGVVLSVILAAGTVLVLQSGCSDDPPAASRGAAEPAEPPTGLPRLVDYGAKSCIPCKMMAPILEDLTKDYAGRFEVEFVDVSLRENAARGKNAGVEMIPTQILYDASGRAIDRHVGFMSKDEILAWWKKHGYDFQPPATTDASQVPAG